MTITKLLRKLILSVSLVLFGFALNAQVSGIIKDAASGEPLPSVSIKIKGTNQGTISNFDGRFNSLAKPNSTLIFSSMGYASKEVLIDQLNQQLIILLEEDKKGNELEEVVVTGFGTQKKSNVTGAISSVKAKDLENMALPRVEQALQGRTSGVIVVQGSGQPGSGSVVRIRGTSSINGSDPLYVVDGVIIGGGIDFLNPNDIASIEVLKDAASGAIYGSRAANGVVIVTTKNGAGKKNMEVSVNRYSGVQNPWKKVPVLNAKEYAMIQNEMNVAAGLPAPYTNVQNLGVGTDWQDAVFNPNAQINTTDVSISGGHSRGSYFASVSNFEQDGIVAPGASNYKRFSARLNTVTNVNNRLKFGWNATYTHNESRGVSENSEFGSPLGRALNIDPLTPVYETDLNALSQAPYTVAGELRHNLVQGPGGYFAISPRVTSEIVNPVAAFQNANGYGWADKFVNSTFAEFKLTDHLKIRSSIGIDLAFWGGQDFRQPYYLNATNVLDTNSVSMNFNRGFTWIWDNSISYDWTMGDHAFDVLAGHSAQEVNGRYLNGSKMDVPTQIAEDATIDYARNIESMQVGGGKWERYAIESYFTRLNYNYQDKYVATAIMRADASTRFGPNFRWGYFPSISAGWNLHNEDFWSDDSKIQTLKIRTGYGLNGSDNAGNLEYASTISGGRAYTFGYGERIINGTSPSQISNPDLRWESVSQANLGIDATFFKNFRATIDVFRRQTNGMKIRPTLPDYIGNEAATANVGVMLNQGVELEFGWAKTLANELYLNFSGNVSFLQNKVVLIGNESGFLQGAGFGPQGLQITRTTEGLPIGYIYGYQTDGVFQNQADVSAYTYIDSLGVSSLVQPDAVAGDFKFKDVNGDGVIDADDRTIIGNPTPDFTFGLTANAAYKGWDISVFLQGMAGNDIFNATRRYDLPTANMPTWALNRWTGPGTTNEYPRLTMNDVNRNYARSSDFYVEDGSFARIKNLQLGYNFKAKFLDKLGIIKCRAYYSGNNLLTFTGYSGFDPEIGSGVGIDRGIYPQARTHSVGINISFK
jgi:TonB-linked SusC/RagA family outer membrane protein